MRCYLLHIQEVNRKSFKVTLCEADAPSILDGCNSLCLCVRPEGLPSFFSNSKISSNFNFKNYFFTYEGAIATKKCDICDEHVTNTTIKNNNLNATSQRHTRHKTFLKNFFYFSSETTICKKIKIYSDNHLTWENLFIISILSTFY